ncbi:MAG: phytoene/squalene synthase family protein [Xanthomonadaceae bacterium]|nr:phytoene/squalene synthase family protein [Xanthomonadaceae bacterium]
MIKRSNSITQPLEIQSEPASPGTAVEFQFEILKGVSRTFALTIPSLPGPLRVSVANAYLLCRIADTIEDDTKLSLEEKKRFSREFVDVIGGSRRADEFAQALAPRLGAQTLAAERRLVEQAGRVIEVTHGFSQPQQAALYRCVSLMSDGMHRFQRSAALTGLRSMAQLDTYCYYVAGVVGEMLTELFCEYSSAIASRRDKLIKLAPSFGQGLQMTNILKDIWDDRERGVCWLPRSVFGLEGPGNDLIDEVDDAALKAGIERLVVQAHGHLRNALAYTLLIPRHQRGIRRFCLWALGMAVPTLRNIHDRAGFRCAEEVKISRRQVRSIVRRYGLMAGSDSMLRWLFKRASAGLPASDAAVGLRLESIVRQARSGQVIHEDSGPAQRSFGVGG